MLARFPSFDALDREISELLQRALGPTAGAPAQRTWAPPVEVFAADGALHVRLELAGIDPERDIDVEVAENRLMIRGTRKADETIEKASFWRREMFYGHFERVLELPRGVDSSAVSASYDAGILEVTIPLPTQQASRVKVAVGQSERPTLDAQG